MSSNQQLLLGEGAGGGIPNYIEEVFSTYLYTGNGSTQTITNGIDLSTKGGLVWIKNRTDVLSHYLWDTVRGITPSSHKSLQSDTTAAQVDYSSGFGVQSVSSTGFELGGLGTGVNGSTKNYVSWTFRKQPKFFDIVTYTGNDTSRSISHSLGSVPGCIIIKNVSAGGFDWVVYHRSNSATDFLKLNTTAAVATNATYFSSAPTSTVFNIGAGGLVNNGPDTYVAYLFAHDAGGFGLAGSDNVISCGSFSSTALNNLGWEPQFVMMKRTDSTSGWFMFDNMRGLTAKTGFTNSSQYLYANTSDAETDITGAIGLDPLGFSSGQSGTYIYIAIRRGPMKVPTVGTSVFSPNKTNASSGTIVTTNVNSDLFVIKYLDGVDIPRWHDRLRGYANAVGNASPLLRSSGSDAEVSGATGAIAAVTNTGFTVTGTLGGLNSIYYSFRRAPGFFDEVCYTGNGASGRTIAHNLGVAPEMMILKSRSDSGTNYQWFVYHKDIPPTPYATNLVLNGTSAAYAWSEIIKTPTTTTFGINDSFGNLSAGTYVAYLFATCAGVSKVGSYTGNGSSQTIACGFAAGSRFVMIKRTDSTGDWYVWDSARGIIAGNDPHLSLNTTAAEVTTDDSVDTDNSGFIVNQVAATNVNVTSATYIFLAIA